MSNIWLLALVSASKLSVMYYNYYTYADEPCRHISCKKIALTHVAHDGACYGGVPERDVVGSGWGAVCHEEVLVCVARRLVGRHVARVWGDRRRRLQ